MCVEDDWLCLSAFHLYANLHMVQALFLFGLLHSQAGTVRKDF